ncbi:MAG TPA: DUF6089 family protein [Phnomibacter sp.]|nr:DUF6089 family protein [Phnomibacter sp.]
MKKHLLTISLAAICALGFYVPAGAQGYFAYWSGVEEPAIVVEAGVTAGVMNGVTDLQGNPRIYQGPFAGTTFKRSNMTVGLYAIGTWRNGYGLRIEANYGHIENYDSLLTNATAPSAIGRKERNLNSRSYIAEVSLVGEFHIPQVFRNIEKPPYRLSPYVLAGVSWFAFNPKAYTADGWVELHPLRLEGQGFKEYPDRKEYKLNAISFPVGIGVRFDVSPRLVLRLEANKRTAETDYLDDVHEPNWVDPNLFANYLSPSQAALARQLYNRSVLHNPPRNTRPRGHPSENDAYWTTTFKVGINLNRSGSNSGIFGGPTRRDMRKRLRCPSF